MERPGGRRALKYLALGDSYTICTGASDATKRWPSIIASRLGAELTNPAVNGFTTLDLIRDELPLVQQLRPDLLSVLIGVNDLVQGRAPKQYRETLAIIYDAVASLADAHIAAISIPNWSYVPAAVDFGGKERVRELTNVFNTVALEEALARRFTWVDIGRASTAGVGSAGWIASDQLHPGDEQYAAWAEAIWEQWKPRQARP